MANDRNSAFLTRLFSTPLKSADYIFGYSLPMIPIAVGQSLCCFITALFFGFTLSLKIFLALLVLLPSAFLFIAFGLLLGSVFSASQVGGISSILINVATWLSGTWFDLDLIGGTFAKICGFLPFVHTIDSVAAVFNGEYASIPIHLLWVLGYAVLICFFATRLFRKRMNP
jgi:ABC-2 type transport system permease protein